MNNKKNVLVIGYFGYNNDQLDGQTIKTRSNFELLKGKEKEVFNEVSYFDTQTFQSSKINLLRAFKKIYKTDILYYVPARKNLTFLFPFIYILCKIARIDIHLIVVGGWLDDFLNSKPIHARMLSKIKGIYPQTLDLTVSLRNKYNYSNVYQLHNFRYVNCLEEKSKRNNKNEKIKLVYMARVHPRKGVATLFKLEKELFRQNISNIEIDVYGPLATDFKDEFLDKINKSKIIRYRQVLQPDEIHKTLRDYDLMLFPTTYFTEGFPGSILDSYIAQVPVIAMGWRYASEYIIPDESGVIVEFGKEKKFIEEVIKLIKNPEKLKVLQEKVKKEKQKYSPEIAWGVLKQNL